MIIVAGAPVVETPPDVAAPPGVYPQPFTRPGLALFLTGVDGSVWALDSEQVRALSGFVGLGDSRPEHRFVGTVWHGLEYRLQQVRIPVLLEERSSWEAMAALDAGWSAATAPEGQCTLTAVLPDGRWRQRLLRREETSDAEGMETDPMVMGHIRYTTAFVADPSWTGPAVRQPFYASDPPAFYPIAPLRVGAKSTTADSAITNAGHVPSWPLYEVTGPMNALTVGVGASLIQYGAVAAGASVFIDTHPDRQTVGTTRGDNSEAAWLGLTGRDFSAVPPGREVPIVVDMVSPLPGASVTVELTPNYRRAI